MKYFYLDSFCFRYVIVMLLLVLCEVPSLSAFQLKQQMEHAVPGDYIITLYQKHYLTLYVLSKNEQGILDIEEKVVPASKKPRHLNWKQWMEQGGPCATSHTIYQIQLNQGLVLSQRSLIASDLSPVSQAFLATLLNLCLEELAEGSRKKTGRYCELNWQPKFVVEGCSMTDVGFKAFRGTWPMDQSELSGRQIEVYTALPSNRYPSFFPAWIQVQGVERGTLSLVDSGSVLRP